MGWLKSLFGKGVLNFEIEGTDRTTGKEVCGDVTLEYEGSLDELNLESAQKEVTLKCWQEGVSVTNIKYMGASST
jgi:hypothetical protein